jgi:chlorobactene glucosyltransferase
MAGRDGLNGWLLVSVEALVGWLAARNYRALPELQNVVSAASDPVSIIIPARNEAADLPALLQSLHQLRYSDYEVVVVDDGSLDGTGEIAASHGARVIRVEGPDAGWTGKSFACWTGARATRGAWLLFTDADTIHGPDSLAAAVGEASIRRAGLLSLLPRQRCETFWERLLLPYAYALYFTGNVAVNKPGGNPVANGQYLLFRRHDYDRIGGHAAVRDSIIEDVALARLAARSGVHVVLMRAEKYLQVRMYQDLGGLWEGFAKNSFRFIAVSPRTGVLTVLAAIAFLAAFPEALRRSGVLRLALLLTPAFSLLPWQRRFGVPPPFAFLYPLAALVFQAIALDSIRRTHTRRGTTWKGRRY